MVITVLGLDIWTTICNIARQVFPCNRRTIANAVHSILSMACRKFTANSIERFGRLA
jgi:hypothetical protein